MPQKKNAKIPLEVEHGVVQLVAMGYERPDVITLIKQQFGYQLSNLNTHHIVNRNVEIIEALRETDKRLPAEAWDILQDSYQMLKSTVQSYKREFKKLEGLQLMYDAGKISYNDFLKQKRQLSLPTMNELITVSREMYNQAVPKVPREAKKDKPISPVLDEETAKRLGEIHRLTIKQGDTLTLERELSPPDDQASTQNDKQKED